MRADESVEWANADRGCTENIFFINKLNIKKKVYLCTLFEVKCFVMD